VDVTWLLGLGLATWTFADGVLPLHAPGRTTSEYVATGALAALLLFGSIVLHETGHWLVARRAGLPVTALSLSLVGGALALAAPPRTPGQEARIAVAGPLASLGAALACALVHVVLVEAGVDPLIAGVPAVVALVNLVPGLPLDGGRLLRAALWRVSGDPAAATGVAHRVGRGVAATLLGLAVVVSASGDAAAATWAALLALTLHVSGPAAPG
jgi:Zn-dependent protease